MTMKNPHEMQEQLGRIAKEMGDLISLRDAEKRAFTTDERSKFDNMKADAERLKVELQDVNTMLELERQQAQRDGSFGKSEKKAIKQFDLISSFRNWASGNKLEGLDKEVQDIYRSFSGPETREGSFLLPTWIPDELRANEFVFTGGTGSGAGVVPKGVDTFIETLRAKMVLSRLGATMLTGLTDYRALPYFSTAAAAYWAGEVGTTTASANVIATKTLSPNPVTAYLPVSKQLLTQHSAIESLIFNDLAGAVGAAIEDGVINGTGTNKPWGLLVSSTISDGTAVGTSTNGGTISWAAVNELIGLVETNNVDTGAFLTSPRGIAQMRSTIAGSSYRFISEMVNSMGYPLEYSSVVGTAWITGATTGCTALIYGNWADLIVAQWGPVELWMDPYSRSISNQILMLVSTFVDAKTKRDTSFARNKSIIP